MSKAEVGKTSTARAPWSVSGRCYVIAEAGVNHNGELPLAMKLVDAAVAANADAVKFQTFRAERFISPVADRAEYQIASTGGHESQLEMVKKLELPLEAFRKLKIYSEECGITFLSTPFEQESADFLDEIGVPAFKLSSGEVTNLDFLRHVARKQKPIILSTGMADLEEVREAVNAIRESSAVEFVLLHCVTNYPSQPASANLRAMETMHKEFGCAVGFSDHTLGVELALAACALGARVIEKHLTLDCKMPGPDHSASLEMHEFASMVEGIRQIESALGDGVKRPAAEELPVIKVARRSLAAAQDLSAGTVLTVAHIAAMRPGTGIAPKLRQSLIGRKVRQPIRAGTLLAFEMFE